MDATLELRAVNIKQKVNIFQALEMIGVRLLHGHNTQQIICPFHDDTKPSSRAYSDSNKLYCFTCHKIWDTISVVSTGKSISYSDAISLIEKHFNLSSPTENISLAVRFNLDKSEQENVYYLGKYAEERLIDGRKNLGLTKYCKLLTALDVTSYNHQHKRISDEEYKTTVRKILSKITST